MKELSIFLFVVIFFKLSYAQAYHTSSPDSIKVVTSDITNFWETFDKLSSVQTFKDTIEIVQKYYLNKASYGLQEYLKASNSNSKDFAHAIKSHKNYLLSIRHATGTIQNHKGQI